MYSLWCFSYTWCRWRCCRCSAGINNLEQKYSTHYYNDSFVMLWLHKKKIDKNKRQITKKNVKNIIFSKNKKNFNEMQMSNRQFLENVYIEKKNTWDKLCLCPFTFIQLFERHFSLNIDDKICRCTLYSCTRLK